MLLKTQPGLRRYLLAVLQHRAVRLPAKRHTPSDCNCRGFRKGKMQLLVLELSQLGLISSSSRSARRSYYLQLQDRQKRSWLKERARAAKSLGLIILGICFRCRQDTRCYSCSQIAHVSFPAQCLSCNKAKISHPHPNNELLEDSCARITLRVEKPSLSQVSFC